MSPVGDAIAKAVIAGPEYRPEYTMAWQFLFLVDNTKAVSMAGTAGEFGKPKHVGSVPLHLENVLLAQPLFPISYLASPGNLLSCYPVAKICQEFK